MAGADIVALEQAFQANERDARALISGLSEAQGTWRSLPDSWSVAECLDHLATGNYVYLDAMAPPAARSLAEGRRRRGPAVPGTIGRWFVRSFEPPVKTIFRMRAPRKIRPRPSPPLVEAAERFFSSHCDVVTFLGRYAEIDLAGVVFPNPFIKGVRFSLATGIHVLAAHERRHLWQAWRVRRGAEQGGSSP